MKLFLPIALTCVVLGLTARAPFIFAGDESAGAGDSVRGEAIYIQECAGCHAVNDTLIGPKHCGVFGRRAGTVPGYAYSDAMKQAGFIWDAKHLDDFLKSPITYLDGTLMGYAGLDSAQDRAAVIAFLRQAMAPSNCTLTASKVAVKPPGTGPGQ